MRYIFFFRIHHWVKNLFVFIPAFFAGELFRFSKMTVLAQGFLCFCLASSAVYILNDYMDMDVDRLHPTKKNRPLASGKISPVFAFSLMIILIVVATGWALYLKLEFLYCILLYVLINLGYSLGLKDVSLLDVFLISAGFLIRTLAGGILVDIPISKWLVIMIFLLSLLLAFSKRRDDLFHTGEKGILRKSARHYNLEFLHICLSIISGVIMVSYIMYTISDEVVQRIGKNSLYLTSLFVFAGILRYLQIALVRQSGGSPTRVLLTDRFIQVAVIGWVLTFFITIYF